MAGSNTYFIIGNGIVGATAAEMLRTENAATHIMIIADDPCPVYYRPALKDYLGGKIGEERLWAGPAGYYQERARRIWHTPRSRSALFWFCFSLICCATFYVLNLIRENAFELVPWFNRIYHGGPAAYLMVLAGATYSLRTRFMRNLPGKAQSWLWMHTWIGMGALFIAGLHENFRFVLYGFCLDLSCITGNYLGMLALYSLIFIVGSGIAGRLFDRWQARVIVQEANTNGIGIAEAVRSHLLELEYVIERLYAGKSDAFKQYCMQTMRSTDEPSQEFPRLMTHEQADFQRAYATLCEHARLERSLAKQERARRVFRGWRTVHMALVPLALLIMSYHGFMELTTTVLHLTVSWLP